MSEAPPDISPAVAPIQDCVLVLGMHRSGTSALAGVLSLLGCATPASLIRGDANNEKGYFESNAIGRLSDAILDELGSAWDDWLPLELGGSAREFHTRIRQTLRDDFAEAPLFVLKEPRMCRMVPLWLKALEEAGCKTHVVHTHRNPQEVAGSLERRDGFDPAFSLLLWLRHVLDGESATRGLARVFTSYRYLMQDWQKVADTLEGALGLQLSSGAEGGTKAIDAFLNDKLQHFNDTAADTLANPALPRNVRDTFAIMERWADTGEQEADYTTLDAIRADLDALAVTFAPLVRPGQMALLALAASQAKTTNATIQDRDLQMELNRTRTELTEEEAEVLKLRDDIQDRDTSLDALARNLDRTRTELATKEAEVLRLRDDIQDRDRSLETQTQTLDQLRADNAQLHQNLARAEADYQTLLQSSSWRMTAPLRHVVGRLRRNPKSS